MRRSEAIRKLMSKLTQTRVLTQAEYESGLYQDMAERHLEFLEKDLGMRPPRLPEDHCQALMDVYYAGYTFYQWEEDFEKDAQAVAALKRRRELQALTPAERIAKRKESRIRRLKDGIDRAHSKSEKKRLVAMLEAEEAKLKSIIEGEEP